MQITEHFSLAELTVTNKPIKNEAPASVMPNIRRTALLLEECRKVLGLPIKVNSGYRNRAVNAAVWGSIEPPSAHLDGRAADIVVPGLTARQVAEKLVASKVQFDKLILEWNAWVHIQVRKESGPARRQVLTKDGTHDYTPGLY